MTACRELHWTTSDQLKIVARYWQADCPRAVCCIHHGLCEHSGRYNLVASELAAAGWDVVAFDARGHGKSEGPRFDAPGYELLREDLRIALRETAKLRDEKLPLHLLGHSWGGNVTLSWLLREPNTQQQIASVTAIAPLLRPGRKPPRWKVAVARVLARLSPRTLLPTQIDSATLSRDQRVGEVFRADPLCGRGVSARLGTMMLDEGEALLQLAADGVQIGVPSLIMHGTADVITDPAASAELARSLGDSCRHVPWPGAFHELLQETNRDQIVARLIEWLDSTADA